ncbi:AraC family transcriptional regulator [Rhodococcus sp. 06-418-5]|uniref:helix-turn-helix domain-containing protein n=1 Tax=unclassified Rhodococcus (in: high G+C Gram-positive bacteria) TaxID=192944 RepID=UPI000B9B34BE|nr:MULTISPECIES: helix-turn-helix domain-containing protein [unclassified Rhodococcus (in: high G+C Gram-positive bacteria)]OZC67765.1 AraC family transcriptional regulator [Rhodococcus sp. 06-470-2]OZC81250.1 AraC family transcriptional regulator [Rhodococcus sp. 06-418-5]OZE62282.1 AraC family transcriptional regulator [Rhodococcus sp. 05-2221-1B]OZE62926.1 AraC family transcriptional regulator [Rhodococcus sp. 05-2221-1B]
MEERQVASKPIDVHERSGVMAPAHLRRFDATWHEPAAEVRDVVDAYWSVRWELSTDETVEQRVLEFPAVTVSVETGAVPAPFMITNVQRRAWSRTIEGRGFVFAVRLRPAGLAVVSDLDPTRLIAAQPITEETDQLLFGMLGSISGQDSAADHALRADSVITEMLGNRPPTAEHLLANAAVDALAQGVGRKPGQSVAGMLGVSERAVQRAMRSSLGMGPKAVARRVRLQEVLQRLSLPAADAAQIAADLGYVDQAHLINDFRGVAGITPGAYLRELATLVRA